MFCDARSPEGFIVKQCECGELPYARRTVAYSGCAAIAAYNLAKLLGSPANWDDVRAFMERYVLLGGRLGTRPRGVAVWLRRRGTDFCRAYLPGAAEKAAGEARAGILLYVHGHGAHYVAFGRRGALLRFYNVSPAAPEEDSTMAEFIKKHSSLPFVYLFTVKAGL